MMAPVQMATRAMSAPMTVSGFTSLTSCGFDGLGSVRHRLDDPSGVRSGTGRCSFRYLPTYPGGRCENSVLGPRPRGPGRRWPSGREVDDHDRGVVGEVRRAVLPDPGDHPAG